MARIYLRCTRCGKFMSTDQIEDAYTEANFGYFDPIPEILFFHKDCWEKEKKELDI